MAPSQSLTSQKGKTNPWSSGSRRAALVVCVLCLVALGLRRSSAQDTQIEGSLSPRPARELPTATHKRTSQFCRPLDQAVDQYLDNLERIRREAPQDRKILVYRMLKEAKSGLGSNMKGIVNMFALAMATDSEYVIETDCPEFSDYFSSNVVRIEPNVSLRKLTQPPTCHKWVHDLPRSKTVHHLLNFSRREEALEDVFRNNPRYTAKREPGGHAVLDDETFLGQVAIFSCDGWMLNRFQDNRYLRENFHLRFNIPIFDAAAWAMDHESEESTTLTTKAPSTSLQHPSVTLLRQDPMRFPANVEKLGYHPALVFGCFFDRILEFSRDVKDKVRETLERKSPVGHPRQPRERLGIQMRSGRGLGWSDSSRIRKTMTAELTSCLSSKIQRWASNVTSKMPSVKQLYVTSDSKGMKEGLEASVLSGLDKAKDHMLLLQPFDQHVYSHTAIAAKRGRSGRGVTDGTQGDRKVIVDFATLMEFDQLWVTRSSFGEVPAWIAASRRPHEFQMRLILHTCRLDPGDLGEQDCSTRWC